MDAAGRAGMRGNARSRGATAMAPRLPFRRPGPALVRRHAISRQTSPAVATLALTPTSTHSSAALLWTAAERAPHAPAFVGADADVSYAALAARAGAFARALRGAGVRPGERVAVLLERGPDAAAAWFGAVAAGAIGVLVNEALRPRQVEHVLDDAGAGTLVSSAAVLARHPRPLRTGARLVDPAAVPIGEEWTPDDAQEQAPAQIIYTSGSTGLPRGVLLSHGNLRACANAVTGFLGLRAEDRTASLLPFSSVYGFNQLLCAVASGGALVVEASPLPSRVARTLAEREVTVLAAVPPLWHALLQAPEFHTPLPALRVMQNAGGHLPRESAARLRRIHPRAALHLMYGLTEVMRSTWLPPDGIDGRPGSIGRAIPGAVVDVVRPDGAPCPPGEAGELVHRGPTVALGYWNRPAETAAVFRPRQGGARAVHTGDLARRDADGFLYFVGRRDRVIKTLGHRVGPDEVADVLFASGEVAEAVVTAEPDAARGERIVAHAVLRADGSADRLHAFCRMEMPRWMHPARIQVHRRLPRTPAGKYDTEALRRAAPA
jgi:acyl-CoA synthetase (AMP-forming)/AMP-acid ligase II